MITAKEAREKTVTEFDALNMLIENDKRYVERRINEATRLGLNKTDVILSNEIVRDIFSEELKSLGYKVKHYGNLSLEIEW